MLDRCYCCCCCYCSCCCYLCYFLISFPVHCFGTDFRITGCVDGMIMRMSFATYSFDMTAHARVLRYHDWGIHYRLSIYYI